MEDKILVITSSMLDQGVLPKEKQTAQGPLPVVADLIDLGINLVPVPNIQKHFELFRKDVTKEDFSEEAYQKYIKSHLVPLVNEVMERVRNGATFLGILSYGADESQRVEPESSPIMIELFRLFDRNCMLTPYYEIKENLPAEEMELIISEIAVSLSI
ncbi:hypothetical protein ACHAL6_12285 [Proteiniclasticum sp. C24MP]|uniref:hypothetical protein n=1 Tax=Proteiniclasticum sp. C24MP TaxID=3374101 RepID=UPI00375534CE